MQRNSSPVQRGPGVATPPARPPAEAQPALPRAADLLRAPVIPHRVRPSVCLSVLRLFDMILFCYSYLVASCLFAHTEPQCSVWFTCYPNKIGKLKKVEKLD